MFWALMKPKVSQTAIEQIHSSNSSFFNENFPYQFPQSPPEGQEAIKFPSSLWKILWYPSNPRQILTKAMHTPLCSYDTTNHRQLCSSNYEEDCWNPLVFVSEDLQLTTSCVWGTHKIYAHKIYKQLWTFLYKSSNNFSLIQVHLILV